MHKSRIFLIGLIVFLIGIAVSKFLPIENWTILLALFLLSGILLIFDDRSIKIFDFWAIMLLVGLAYPNLLGREQLVILDPTNPILVFFAKTKAMFLGSLSSLLPEPIAAFAQGVSIGERSDLPRSIKQAFINTGTLHIVAVSGYNFTILLRLFAEWLRNFGRKRTFIIGTLTIIGFILLVGGQPSVVRAGIMGWLFFLAPAVGRLPNITIALVLAATVMTVFEPRILTENLSFQLSFLSMLGLITIEPKLIKWLDRTNWRRFLPKALRDGLTATLAAQIMTLGLTLAVFGRFSLIAPLPNMLIAPLMPLATISSLVAGGAGMIGQELGQLVAYPAWLVLKIILAIIEFFGEFSFAALKFAPWPWWWAIGYYGIIAIVLWLLKDRKLSPTDNNSKLKSQNAK